MSDHSKERHFISLGAGVQSSVMLLLADRGELTPRPEGAVFADTQWEPPEVYRHLEWLESEVSIPIHRVTAGDIRANSLDGVSASGHRNKDGGGFVSLPLFTAAGGLGRRTCTNEYKIRPLEKKVRRLCGVAFGERFPVADTVVVQWLGITTDEASRMRVSRTRWQRFRYPLVDLGWHRRDCRGWFAKHYPGRRLPRSACVACPFRSNEEWREIKKDPELWRDAVEYDREIRNVSGLPHFVHVQKVPLDEVDLGLDQGDLWDNECEGMCGV